MSLKIALLLFACCTIVIGYSVESRVKRQAVDQSTDSDATDDDTSNDSSTNDVTNIGSNIRNSLMEMGNRIRDALNKTFQEETNSVGNSWNNVKDLITQRIQTGANLTKTAIDLGTIIPKFGKNLILSGDDDTSSTN